MAPMPMALSSRPPPSTRRGPARSVRRPATNIMPAETNWNRPTARPSWLRSQPSSCTIGLKVRPTAKRAPPPTNSARKPAARMSAAREGMDFCGKEEFARKEGYRISLEHDRCGVAICH
jgi:hypothetical protein